MTEKDHKSIAIVDRCEIAPVHPLAMVQHAVQNGLNPDTIAKLMDLAERHEANEARKAYTTALVGLKRDLPTVLARDKEVSYSSGKGKVRYTHTSLGAAIDAVTEPLTQHGFSLSWEPSTDESKVKVTCRLTHAQGHSESCTLTAPIDNSGSKSPAQGIASTITLLERYTALSLLGIATADHKEPQQETPTDHVDTAMNQRALKAWLDAGHDRGEAEERIGRPMEDWTIEDLRAIKKWLSEEQYENVGPPPMREPGEDG